MLKTTTNADTGKETTVLSRKSYDFFKNAVQKYLPALASLYFGLSQIWGFPAGEEVVGTIALLTTFLGVVVGVSHARFNESTLSNDGQLVVTSDGGGVKNVLLELDGDPENLPSRDKIVFKVKNERMPEPPVG